MTNILNIISLQTNPNGWEKNILILFFWQKNHQLQSSVHESKELNFSWNIHEEIIEGTSSSPIISFRLWFCMSSKLMCILVSLPPSLGVKEIVIVAEHTLFLPRAVHWVAPNLVQLKIPLQWHFASPLKYSFLTPYSHTKENSVFEIKKF